MVRPNSYCGDGPEICCRNCKYSLYPRYKDDLFCLYGDVVDENQSYPIVNGLDLDMLEGEEYARLWERCAVVPEAVCDEFVAKEK